MERLDGPVPERLPDGEWVRVDAVLDELLWRRNSRGDPWLEFEAVLRQGSIRAFVFPRRLDRLPREVVGHGSRTVFAGRVCLSRPMSELHLHGLAGRNP